MQSKQIPSSIGNPANPEDLKTPAIPHDSGDDGYHKGLSNRQVQMIAMGGAIGVGLFLGAGGRLVKAGPSLVLAYAICGILAFLLMRALGELVMHRPSSGSFVSYAREFFGDKWAYVVGWMYMLNWMTTGIAEITAVATYVQKWAPHLPQWIPALVALCVVLAINLFSVKAFGEFEFWAALLKVVALISFIIIGTGMVLFGAQVQGHTAAVSNLWSFDGGFAPHGLLPMVLVMQGVVFAYASIEMVGTAAGEAQNPREVMPKAIRSVIYRIIFFYIGSVLLLGMLLPYTAYKAGESPFVTVFGSMGYSWIADAMNVVVLTAALSSCNSGLYTTGRVLRSLAAAGEAPKFTLLMSKTHVPYGGILLTASVYFLGVILNYYLPHAAFEIALETAAVGIVWTWGTIFACQIALRRKIDKGELPATSFPMPGAPLTSWIGLAMLAVIVGIMWTDDFNRTVMLWSTLYIALLVAGWFFVKKNKERMHNSGQTESEVEF